MPLNDDERNLSDSLYWEKSQPIRDKYDAALKKLDYANGTNKDPFYLDTIERFAREDIGAYVSAHKEVYERFGKYPDEADFEAFVDELRGMVPRFKDYYASRHQGITSPQPVEVVDRNLEVLSQRVQNIIGQALTPLHRLMIEGRIAASLMRTALKVFISYKWEDDAHNIWVEKFATDLRAAGIDAKLDKWEVRLGDSFTDYMTSKIAEADVVLFIMTSRSVAAAEAPMGEGGAVKFEMQMATSRRIAGEKMRLIGIYREGNQTAAHLRDHKYADFRDDSQYDVSLKDLIDDLLGKDKRPPLNVRVDSDSEHGLDTTLASSTLDKRDLSVLRAIYSYSLENDTAFIDIGRFTQSKPAQSIASILGDKLYDSIELLADSGYFDNPRKVGGKLIIVQGNSYGFEACAHLVGFPTFEKLLSSAIRKVVQHGTPMTGDILANALIAYGELSPIVILYVIKAMRNRGWLRFAQTMGNTHPIITGVSPQGRRAAE